eukprot:comp23175_c1_seq1/m.37545 comp23175_c1_seq1/g.37545  ORF comp23175_c1_seq1/g.37545 comp23175_c1_seq1/m.37545 type:complete len:319 (+) comp23175_c1_seq1:680-1636(+)
MANENHPPIGKTAQLEVGGLECHEVLCGHGGIEVSGVDARKLRQIVYDLLRRADVVIDERLSEMGLLSVDHRHSCKAELRRLDGVFGPIASDGCLLLMQGHKLRIDGHVIALARQPVQRHRHNASRHRRPPAVLCHVFAIVHQNVRTDKLPGGRVLDPLREPNLCVVEQAWDFPCGVEVECLPGTQCADRVVVEQVPLRPYTLHPDTFQVWGVDLDLGHQIAAVCLMVDVCHYSYKLVLDPLHYPRLSLILHAVFRFLAGGDQCPLPCIGRIHIHPLLLLTRLRPLRFLRLVVTPRWWSCRMQIPAIWRGGGFLRFPE